MKKVDQIIENQLQTEPGLEEHFNSIQDATQIVEAATGLEETKIEADRQLSKRPSFTIRTRIILTFSLIFALCGAITLWSIWALSELETKIQYLDISGNYLREIQQARRFEKNYFLYGTNLDDSLDHVTNAESIITNAGDLIKKILGTQNYQIKLQQVKTYKSFLNQLKTVEDKNKKNEIELALRKYGSTMVSFASELVEQEKEAVTRMLRLSRQIPFYFLAVLLGMMVFIGTFFARNLLGTLSRFMRYTERIGQGDFSPIIPKRKYQDEFSQLAKAFNHMIRELDRRHRILVESHKLRAIGTLVAGVAHELNNPLNNIMLTASVFAEDFTTLRDHEKLEMIDDLLGETERAQKIVRNLLDFARESKTFIKPLKIDAIIEDSVHLVANQLKLAKLQLETDFPENLPLVHGDEQMLKQVFVNLILNAVDVLPPKGRITLSISKGVEDNFLAVDVKDNGPGIPEHILERIFDPFFTTKTKGRGTGLGLSVSQGIVRKLGGIIRVTSGVGIGSTFTVLLPTTNLPSHH
jgi:two-component system, NtrC family, sensor kinase